MPSSTPVEAEDGTGARLNISINIRLGLAIFYKNVTQRVLEKL